MSCPQRCRTGLSQGHIGREGATGLTNGLFDAGAERVGASLWSVHAVQV